MFSLNFRDELSGGGHAIVEELDQIAAAVQTKWAKQHTWNGAHGAVTATSAHAPILGLGAPVALTIPLALTLTNFGVPVVVPQRTSFLSLAGTAAGSYASVDSIEIPGAQEGDLLVVYFAGYLRLNSKGRGAFTSCAPGNRLTIDSLSAPDITYSGETFGQTPATARGMTFIRHNGADFTDSFEDRFPAWVQIG